MLWETQGDGKRFSLDGTNSCDDRVILPFISKHIKHLKLQNGCQRHTKAVKNTERHKLRLIKSNVMPVGYSVASFPDVISSDSVSASFSGWTWRDSGLSPCGEDNA
jgi:hypothetical protein